MPPHASEGPAPPPQCTWQEGLWGTLPGTGRGFQPVRLSRRVPVQGQPPPRPVPNDLSRPCNGYVLTLRLLSEKQPHEAPATGQRKDVTRPDARTPAKGPPGPKDGGGELNPVPTALAWWRVHASLQFGLVCLAAKLGIEMLGLDWNGPAGFVQAASPALDFLAFLPACMILFEGINRLPTPARALALVAGAVVIAAAIIADLLTLEFFHAHFPSVLPVLLKTHALSATGSNLLELLPGSVLMGAALFVAIAAVAFRRQRAASRSLLVPSLLLLLGYAVVANHGSVVQASLDAVTHEGFDYAEGTGDRVAERPLRAARHMAPELRAVAPYAPSTIVVFINESCPWQFASSASPGQRLFDKIINESGLEAGNWHIFKRAFTNSSTTDISMPCIMTGADPTAGTEEVEKLPFIYAMARIRGYETGFFTSQDYGWASLRTYFSSDELGHFVSGEVTGQKGANLLGIDDMYIAQEVADCVDAKGPAGRLFLVVNNNALHVPFQTESAIAIPAYAKEAKQKAAYIIEQFYAVIFRSLERTRRLKDSLIIMTSDHGEMDPLRRRDVIRLDSHYDEVANIPLALYLPPSVPAALRQRLEANSDKTVANMDIAPTLMDALGLALPAGEQYPGYDLFASIPSGRVSVSVSNNEWKPWHLSAFGLACGDDRMVFHQKLGLMYFDVRSDPAQTSPITSGSKFDAYRAYIAVHPTLPKWLNSAGTD